MEKGKKGSSILAENLASLGIQRSENGNTLDDGIGVRHRYRQVLEYVRTEVKYRRRQLQEGEESLNTLHQNEQWIYLTASGKVPRIHPKCAVAGITCLYFEEERMSLVVR